MKLVDDLFFFRYSRNDTSYCNTPRIAGNTIAIINTTIIILDIIFLVLLLLKFISIHLFHDWRFTMRFPTFLALVLTFTAWLTYELRKHSGKPSSFWEKENAANNVPKKSLDTLHYITIPIDSLPFFLGIDEKLEKIQKDIKELSSSQIVDLSHYTNTELKLLYGTGNLSILTKYDQNFTFLSRLLLQWGARLNELNYIAEAIQVLEFGVKVGTENKAHYLLLAQLYLQTEQSEKIQSLIMTISNSSSLLKDSIVRQLQELGSSALMDSSIS